MSPAAMITSGAVRADVRIAPIAGATFTRPPASGCSIEVTRPYFRSFDVVRFLRVSGESSKETL